MPLSDSEANAFEKYIAENALKKGPWLRLLVIRELQKQSLLSDPDYQPPTVQSALKKGARK